MIDHIGIRDIDLSSKHLDHSYPSKDCTTKLETDKHISVKAQNER